MLHRIRYYGWLLAFWEVLVGAAARAQGPAPTWQKTIVVGPEVGAFPHVNASFTDSLGNVYLTGIYQYQVSLGSLKLTSTGKINGFVVKWSAATQQFAWAKVLEGNNQIHPETITARGASMYVAGHFSEKVQFGAVTLNAGRRPELFVLKLLDTGRDGQFGWAQQARVLGYGDNTPAKALVASGPSLYLTGCFTDTARLGTTTLISAGSTDVFVAKLLDAGRSGRFVWAQQAGGKGEDYGHTLAVVGTKVYVAGHISDDATFGSIQVERLGSEADMFVAKLLDIQPAPMVIWAKQMGSGYTSTATALAARGDSVYVAGCCVHAINIGASAEIVDAPTNVVVLKLRDTGGDVNVGWVQQARSIGNMCAKALVLYGSNLYLTGTYTGKAFFGTTILEAPTFSNTFVARLADNDFESQFTWAYRVAAVSNSEAGNVAVTSAGRLCVVYGVRPPARSDGFIHGLADYMTKGYIDFFSLPH